MPLGRVSVSCCLSLPHSLAAQACQWRDMSKVGSLSVSICKHAWRGAQHLNDHTHPRSLAYGVHTKTKVVCGSMWVGEVHDNLFKLDMLWLSAYTCFCLVCTRIVSLFPLSPLPRPLRKKERVWDLCATAEGI